MKKTELVEQMAHDADLSKASAERALEAFVRAVQVALQHRQTVTVPGLGTFAITHRPARVGRNPRTGAAVEIKASNAPKFKPGKGLKDAVN